MFDISIENSKKTPKSVVCFLFSLGCFPYCPISEQRGGMNPIPATSKTSFDRNWFFVGNSEVLALKLLTTKNYNCKAIGFCL
jgi:hypothetical protein